MDKPRGEDSETGRVMSGLVRFYVAIPALCAGVFFVWIALNPSMYSKGRSEMISTSLVVLFSGISLMMVIGGYKIWRRDRHWLWWMVGVYCINFLGFLVLGQL